MSHFYGGVEGNRGPATRQGSKDSGVQAYAQGYRSRISVGFHYNQSEDCDAAHISIGGGWTTYHRSRTIAFSDIDLVAEALDCGDPKMDKLWEQVRTTIDKIEAEAAKAIKRQQKVREREERKERREQREKAKRLSELRQTITHAERHYYLATVLGIDEEERIRYFPTDDKVDDSIISTNPEPYRDDDGRLIVGSRSGGTWGRLNMYDISTGTKVEREEVKV